MVCCFSALATKSRRFLNRNVPAFVMRFTMSGQKPKPASDLKDVGGWPNAQEFEKRPVRHPIQASKSLLFAWFRAVNVDAGSAHFESLFRKLSAQRPALSRGSRASTRRRLQ
jgi:hypothetical protein